MRITPSPSRLAAVMGSGPKGGRPVVEEGRGKITSTPPCGEGVACCGAKGAQPSGRNVR